MQGFGCVKQLVFLLLDQLLDLALMILQQRIAGQALHLPHVLPLVMVIVGQMLVVQAYHMLQLLLECLLLLLHL